MPRCPVCKETEKMQVQVVYGGPAVEMDAPLYQISYKGSPEYVPPRCSHCISRVQERRAKKLKMK
ncbi:hypothetical protein ES703_69802 [subsurface metagenome]